MTQQPPHSPDCHTALKALQSRRLFETYSDFVEKKAYRATCDYFFGEVYNTDDTEARDHAFAQFTAKIAKVLGGDIVRCLRLMIRLQRLTLDLDLACVATLAAQGAGADFDLAAYEQAYRDMDRYQERREQIELTLTCLTLAHRIFRRFGIGTGLYALHEFHRMRGDDLITGFLWRGYQALHRLPNIQPLADAVQRRETSRLQRIFEKAAS